MRIYLDNCCFNRPFDDQKSIRVKLETDAKLYVQALILEKKLELAWSYILDFENDANPLAERKEVIEKWQQLSTVETAENDFILLKASTFVEQGIKPKDSLHLSCAIFTSCDYFLTTDDQLQKKAKDLIEIKVLNPVEFINVIVEL